ncbi:MAG TPA: hypothetical protein VJN01_12320, partial [Xanthomonadales bacterium]|nr:hypothetical protein [Xanthomonadales bacterium]
MKLPDSFITLEAIFEYQIGWSDPGALQIGGPGAGGVIAGNGQHCAAQTDFGRCTTDAEWLRAAIYSNLG